MWQKVIQEHSTQLQPTKHWYTWYHNKTSSFSISTSLSLHLFMTLSLSLSLSLFLSLTHSHESNPTFQIYLFSQREQEYQENFFILFSFAALFRGCRKLVRRGTTHLKIKRVREERRKREKKKEGEKLRESWTQKRIQRIIWKDSSCNHRVDDDETSEWEWRDRMRVEWIGNKNKIATDHESFLSFHSLPHSLSLSLFHSF